MLLSRGELETMQAIFDVALKNPSNNDIIPEFYQAFSVAFNGAGGEDDEPTPLHYKDIAKLPLNKEPNGILQLNENTMD